MLTPRINNNDDVVRVARLAVHRGDAVKTGDLLAELETDKGTFTVEAESGGYVLAVVPSVDQMVGVGSVLLWLGETPHERVPADPGTLASPTHDADPPTMKAAQLLARLGLRADQVPATGARLSVSDVEAFVQQRGRHTHEAGRPTPAGQALTAPGHIEPLTASERGMLRTVEWQRQHAVPAYVEIEYDATIWERAAAEYQRGERALLNPLLALMAYRLVEICRDNPRLRSTIVDEHRFIYSDVNLGFTVQSDTTLYMVVVKDAAILTRRQFVERLSRLQRKALAQSLHADETTGATTAFTSMARWSVTRHVPVLPPGSSLILAHSASTANGRAALGATYDHRVLTGFEALSAVTAVSRPEDMS